MAEKTPEQGDGVRPESLENFEQMVWMYLDEVLPEEDFPKVEELLKSDDSYMQVYLDCAQLHAELAGMFQPPSSPSEATRPQSPVLGSLGEGLPGIDSRPPVT